MKTHPYSGSSPGGDWDPAVVRNSRTHPFQAVHAVGRQTEELSGFRNAKSSEPAVEAVANDAVVRAVLLEKERLADGQSMELPTTPWTSEIGFCLGDLGTRNKELVPLAVGHCHITRTTVLCTSLTVVVDEFLNQMSGLAVWRRSTTVHVSFQVSGG
jgi:hypothetical protein